MIRQTDVSWDGTGRQPQKVRKWPSTSETFRCAAASNVKCLYFKADTDMLVGKTVKYAGRGIFEKSVSTSRSCDKKLVSLLFWTTLCRVRCRPSFCRLRCLRGCVQFVSFHSLLCRNLQFSHFSPTRVSDIWSFIGWSSQVSQTSSFVITTTSSSINHTFVW